jgi:DNA-binding transcriptional MerR regulator
LLPAPPRTEGGQRRYAQGAVQRLGFIRHARDLGFDIAAIRELIALAGEPDRPCADADRIASAQLDSVKSKIAGLKLLQKELERMLHNCAHGTISDCRVVETLGDHALCASGMISSCRCSPRKFRHRHSRATAHMRGRPRNGNPGMRRLDSHCAGMTEEGAAITRFWAAPPSRAARTASDSAPRPRGRP